MNLRSLDRMSLDVDLLIARRRAESCTLGSPSWDAAMGLVEELEDALRQVESRAESADERPVLAQACN